jgi:rhodanese-related sulfurtransferase
MNLFPFQAFGENPQLAMVAAVLVGFGFGFVLERAGFGNARKLAAQFYGTEMVMLKVMFTAIVTAILGVVVVSGLGLLDLRALADSVTSATFLWPMIAGGLLIGVGIILSGYCPGTSLVGIASGKLDAVLAYGGVILGQVLWAELEFRGPVARFHSSGALGHVYLYDLLGVPPAALAAAIVLVAVGAFLLGEKIERLVTGAPGAAAPARRWVFAGAGALGLAGLATLLLPVQGAATPPPARRISAPELARRVLEEPWKVRVLDVRAREACAAQRVPGAECAPEPTLKDLQLADVSPARDLVVVAEGERAEPPAEARAYRGNLLVLDGGFAAWKAWALTPPAPLPSGAGLEEQEAHRVRAGIHAALTGSSAPPPPPPTGGGAPVKRKASGGGCSG